MNLRKSKNRPNRRLPVAATLVLAAIAAAGLFALIGSGPSAAAASGVRYSPTYNPGAKASASADPCAKATATKKGLWLPQPTTAPWQWQLQGKVQTDLPACVYELDGFETSKATVADLHGKGVKVICYLDVGSWEEYRPDAGQFPESSLGAVYEGYPEERWLDAAHYQQFAGIMEKRIAMCAHKGFDGVEPDNINAWENKSGFPLTGADQLRYNLWIARQVHQRGMSVALKNDPRQVKQLVGNFDFAVVEECFQYQECADFKPFIAAGKAVFEAEYELPPAKFCAEAKSLEFSSTRKGVELFAKPFKPCEQLPASG